MYQCETLFSFPSLHSLAYVQSLRALWSLLENVICSIHSLANFFFFCRSISFVLNLKFTNFWIAKAFLQIIPQTQTINIHTRKRGVFSYFLHLQQDCVTRKVWELIEECLEKKVMASQNHAKEKNTLLDPHSKSMYILS